ncbi:MAG: ATP-grasp domain-containing protein [Sphingobacteriales bacterium]|nr:ATP-grasp domain-containing protein [Sphingobacteriales bacterium]
MNLLFSCIGRRGYMVDYFKAYLSHNDRIVGTSNTPWTTGLKRCDASYIMPDIANEELYIQKVLEVCRIENITAILSFYDDDVEILSKHLNEFERIGVFPILPKHHISTLCFDKYKSFNFLTEHKFYTPFTVNSLEAAYNAIADGYLQFPLIIKPQFGFGSKNVFTVYNIEQMPSLFHYDSDPMIIQNKISGTEYCLDIFNNKEGEVISVVCKQKLAMRAGEVDQSVTVYSDLLFEEGKRLGKAVGHIGPLDVDIFVRDNKVYIIELNPRFGGAYPISHEAGANFIQLVIDMVNGKKLNPHIGNYEQGVQIMKEYSIVKGLPTITGYFNK